VNASWQWPSAQGLDPSWQTLWRAFEDSEQGRALKFWLEVRAAQGASIVPANTLRALELTAFERVRVIILGQDPYHGPGQAHGLAFSVPDGVRLPPSLRNIYAELETDLKQPPPPSGNLTAWARQGVLLLNTVLTVELGQPAAHAKRGWEVFTRNIVCALASDPAPKVFMLWGAHAQRCAPDIKAAGPQHNILTAHHPSPLSARRGPTPFLGCQHFSCANTFLRSQGRGHIQWGTPSSKF